MRRIAAVLGVLLLLVGVKAYEVTPADCGYRGEETVFADSVRFDFVGDEMSALDAVAELDGAVLWSETAGDATIYYAYSPRIYRHVTLGGERVNLMVAVRGGNVCVGSPMLEGSY